MAEKNTDEQALCRQIKRSLQQEFSTASIEARIAESLLQTGTFQDAISADELSSILRNITFVMFERQKVAGFDVGVVHNIPSMSTHIEDGEARVSFVVHIHKPIVVFIEFDYKIVNDDSAETPSLCLKKNSLNVTEKTRRFDIKAKAALTALNVPRIVRHELSDLSSVILQTLPEQLRQQGVEGELSRIELMLIGDSLNILLEGAFTPLNAVEPASAEIHHASFVESAAASNPVLAD